jgi:anti-anti-sigma factor
LKTQGNVAFDVEIFEEIVVIRITGDLNPESMLALADVVSPHMVRRTAHVLLNLDRAPRVDAAGLGLVASLCQMSKSAGCTLTLTNVHARVRESLDAVGLSPLIDIAASESDAIEDFEMSPGIAIAV